MFEVTDVRKDHDDAMFVCCSDGFFVTLASAGLHDNSNSVASKHVWAIAEWKERIACCNCAVSALASTFTSKPGCINSVLLTSADSYRLTISNKRDGVG
jgi:hypothetical protein